MQPIICEIEKMDENEWVTLQKKKKLNHMCCDFITIMSMGFFMFPNKKKKIGFLFLQEKSGDCVVIPPLMFVVLRFLVDGLWFG